MHIVAGAGRGSPGSGRSGRPPASAGPPGGAKRPAPNRRRGLSATAWLLTLGPLLTGLAAGSIASAQESAAEASPPEVRVEAALDRSTAAPGEPLILSVTATHPRSFVWEPRSVADRHGTFDIEQIRGPETAEAPGGSGASATTAWSFRLRAFELGEVAIPPLALRYRAEEGGEVLEASTPELKVRIESSLEDPNAEAADIRSGFALPGEPMWRIWLLAGVAALAAAALLWWWLRRRRRRPAPAAPVRPPEPARPARPAYDRYLEELEALLAERLAEAGRHKELHIRISGIVKGYLGEVFAFDAIDLTTLEVMARLGALARPTLRSETGEFLSACDLVKFAEYVPGAEACRDVAERARRILEMGRPAFAPPPGSAAGRAEARP